MRAFLLFALTVWAIAWPKAAPAAAQYFDDFEDERVGERPSHWMESVAEENWNAPKAHWLVAATPNHPGERALLADESGGERKALLHTFGSNVRFAADFLVVRQSQNPKAQLSFLVRHNSDKDRLEITHELATRYWEIRERTGIVKKREDGKLINNPSRLLATTLMPLQEGWNHIEITVVQTRLIARLNGRDLMAAVKLEHLNYGRVGFEVRYADVMFDNVSYSGDGEGRVHDGVKEIGNMHHEIYSDIFKTPDGQVTVKSNQGSWGVLQSADDGETWQFLPRIPMAARHLNQVEVLDNKHIVDISTNEIQHEQWVYDTTVSADGGASWSSAARLPRDPVPFYMEAGRLRPAYAGRLLFFIDYPRRQGSQLYYSDDEGAHWTIGPAFTPATLPATFQKIRRFEAPHVVACGDNRLAIFFRTNRDYHYRLTSEDNGLTWSEPYPVFTLRSSLSDASFDYDPKDKFIYAVWMHELRRDPPGCKTEGQWPRERMVLTRSSDCGTTWTYLMDLDNWEGNDARFNQMVLRVIGDNIWVSADTHVASAPTTCGGAAYAPALDHKNYDWRRLYRVDKRKLEPLPQMPLLLTR